MRKRIFILGGGPSLADTELGWLQKEDTIAVNRMGPRMTDPTYFLTADSGIIRSMAANNFQEISPKTKKVVVINKDEHPRWHQVKEYVGKYDEHVVPTRWDGEISFDKSAFATGKNSGFCALQYAIHLGYKEIYLMGVDLQLKDGAKYYWEKGTANPSPFDLFYQHYATGLRRCSSNGIRVYSCSPISRLNKHIKYVDWKTLVPRMPIFVSHYTNNTPYEKIIEKLIESLNKHNLDYDTTGIDTLGSWRANSNYCAWQVRDMLVKYSPRPIIRVDADAVVQQYPELFIQQDFKADVAAAIWTASKLRPEGEFMAGTIYFDNNDRTKILSNLWVEKCTNLNTHRNGDLLWAIIQRLKKAGDLTFAKLPLSYCRIFDFDIMGKEKVIEHFQASRRCKATINRMSIK